MIKYVSFLTLFLCSFVLFSQCDVNENQGPMIADPDGVYNCQILNGDFITDENLFEGDSLDRTAFPNAITGQLYEAIVGIRIPNDTSFVYELTPGEPQLFENVAINSISINSVDGIPMGFTWECVGGPASPDDCTWSGGDYGCIKFFSEGMVDATLAGDGVQAYPLNVLLDVSATYELFPGVPIPIELTVDDLLNYYVLVIEEEENSSISEFVDVRDFGLIGVSPNPANDYLTLKYANNNNNEVDVKIYDILGNLVESKKYNSIFGYNEITINTARLVSGIYTLSLSNNSESIIERIIID